ncbi:MAG: GH3 auxin-responsive promoter family protein [Coleofasciculaceae cyanobacterium RL_1_1]|nr:GH3 auxin-responsive promoter family protein [Coleofasciculaceae cyanobacterium RL_1_1]
MSSLSLSLLKFLGWQAKHRLIRHTRSAQSTQEKFLRTLINHHRNTKIGTDFKLSKIQTIEQFRQHIPIYPYEFYESYTDRIVNGETNVLTPDKIDYINLTSGSTGRKKQVPVTARFQASLRRADLASLGFALDALRDRQSSFGRSIITNSAQIQGITPGGTEFGPVSVGSLRKGQFLFEQGFSLPYAALNVSDTAARHYVCLLFALSDADMRGFITNFPMLVLRTCQYLEDFAESLIQDLAQGTIAPDLPIDPPLRRQLEGLRRPNPRRADFLRAALERDGRLTPKAAWPKLSYVFTARGGTSDFYFDRFPAYFGDTPIFGGIYGTAEGTFSVIPAFNVDGGILAIESGFFEFIAEDHWHEDQPPTLLPHEVQVGHRYRILVTSYSGFYRYDIGDVIEVTGFYNAAPRIVFRHRRGGLLSSTTEKTTEFHAIETLRTLQEEFQIKLEDFCITLADDAIPGGYVVNIELASGYTLADPDHFLKRFEYWMATFNEPYGTVRQSQVPPPRLRVLRSGSFVEVRRRQVQRGMFDSQLKILHIQNDSSLLADLPIEQEVLWDTPLSAMLF